MFLGKSVNSLHFFTGFAVGKIETVTVFAVVPAERDKELASVFALLVKDISFGKAEKFVAEAVLYRV